MGADLILNIVANAVFLNVLQLAFLQEAQQDGFCQHVFDYMNPLKSFFSEVC